MDGQVAILVVEDNVDDIMILRRHFSRLEGSYRVEIAYTAAEALTKIAAQPFDIAFIDRHLPDARGEALISELANVAPDMPLVMLTGQGDERLAVEVMKAGAYDYLRKDDLSRSILSRTLRNVLERARLRARIDAAHAELAQLAIRDGLTGLFNRRHFGQLVETEFARARRYGQSLACLMLDIDRFKRFNDTRGHQCGDAVLRHVADILRGVARQVDVVARYGGEEFVVLLPNTDIEGALRVAERIRAGVAERPLRFGALDVGVTVSVGVATNAESGVETTEALVKLADDGLYAAKRAGRNRVGRAERLDAPATPDAILRRRTSTLLIAGLVDAHEAQVLFRPHQSQRTASLAARLATRLGCDLETYEAVILAARLGELGRLVLPVPAQADDATQRAIAASTEALLAESGLAPLVFSTLRHRFEHWDGSGPMGLKGEAILEGGRLLALVDAWLRPIGPVGTPGLRALAGARLDPALVEVFSDLQMSDTASA